MKRRAHLVQRPCQPLFCLSEETVNENLRSFLTPCLPPGTVGRGITLIAPGNSRPVNNSDKQIDCIGLFCPIPIVRTREAIRELAVGEVLEMLSDDPASDADMKSWSRRTGHELLEIVKNGAVYHFFVRKTR